MVASILKRKHQMRRYLIPLLSSFLVAAPAQAATEAELKEMTAAIINMNGMLCAKAVEIRGLQLEGQFEVTCIEYRGGSGTVRYIMDAQKGTAFRAD
jgi:hypothetical protein